MLIKKYKNHLISSKKTIRNTIIKLGKLNKKFCIIVDKDKKFFGTLTDGDIRRGLLKNFNLSDEVSSICNRKSSYVTNKSQEYNLEKILEKKKLLFLPILDKEKKITNIYFRSNMQIAPKLENEMIIMAGGIGKRLRPFTQKIPKPLLPVNGKPIIEQIILMAKNQGVKKITITINYLGHKIKNYLKDGRKLNVEINYIHEEKPLGTAGSLFYLKKIKKPFIVSNADIISNINYNEMLNYHNRLKSFITIGAISNFEKNHYGNIVFENNKVLRIEEKKEKKSFINAGIYILSPLIKKFLKSKKFIHMTDLIELAILKKKKVHLFPIHENWFDYGIKEKYLKNK